MSPQTNSPAPVGRPRRILEPVIKSARFPLALLARMDAALLPGETFSDFLLSACQSEVMRRGGAAPQNTAKPAPAEQPSLFNSGPLSDAELTDWDKL